MMDSDYMDTSDIEITLTYKEHKLLNDVLMSAIDNLITLCPSGWRELPNDSELRQRFKDLEDLQGRFSNTYSNRFN